jgi:peptidoglycan hydrolase-like protein with peptidoglycan-binding domain
MRALRALFVAVLTVALLGAAAYGTGMAVRHYEGRASAAPERPAAPDVPSAGTSAPTPEETATPTPEPEPENVLDPGARGEQVRELQHRLFQLAWLPETTTGRYDATTREAVAGFQGKRDLKTTGVVDQRTWRRLVAMTDQPTHDQMFNVLHPGPAILAAGDRGEQVRDLQARLKSIQWIFGDVTGSYDDDTVEAVRGFQAKRAIPVTGEVDQRTLDRLHAMTVAPSQAAMHNELPETGSNQPGALDPRCETGRVMCIDKTSQTLRWVVDGKVLKTMDVRFGASYSPTREGLFHVSIKDEDHVSHLYGSEMPFSMFFSGGQAVHYSSDFASRGYAGASHGCVNVRDYDGLAWLFGQVQVGDAVVVYWS